MTSFVHYRFKFQKDDKKIGFEGTGISVSEIKEHILAQNGLNPNDLDVVIYDASGQREFNDESFIVPRSTSLVAKRVPARQGARKPAPQQTTSSSVGDTTGTSSQPAYLRGRGAMSKRFDGKDDALKSQASQPITTNQTSSSSQGATGDEAAAMAAMFKAQTDVWEETQEKMSHATPIYSSTRGTGRGGKPFTPRQTWQQPDRPLPPSYVCYRCGQKGHWIYDCPTNNDKDFDNRPRIKRTTGIPRSFLKTVEAPSEANASAGVMITPEGGFVVAQPDVASWQKQVQRTKGLTPADIREKPPPDPTMACPIDNKLFKECVKTPCCGTRYCEDCIHAYLLDHDFICPKCSKKIHSLEHLGVDKPMRTKVGDYIDKVIKEHAEAEAEALKASETEEKSPPADNDEEGKNDEEHYDEQPGSNFNLDQLVNETIPQLQGQVQQLSIMLQNPSLPPPVRQSTMNQFQQTQMQLQQAQTFAALAADLSAAAAAQAHAQAQQNAANVGMEQGFQQVQQHWVQNQNRFVPQPPQGLDSAYQRLPVNNRRRNIKRERPSDFLEIGTGESSSKMPKFWE